MRYGSLFTGIGGIDLGLERAGMECAWQVENDPYCIKVLEKHSCRSSEDVAHAEGFGVEGHRAGGEQEPRAHGQTRLPVRESKRRKSTHWTTEPDVGRVAHGVPKRIHRLRGLGNAVVPQVAEWMGERIMEHHQLGML